MFPGISEAAAKDESGALGASRSLSRLLLLARLASGSAELGVGNFDGGGIAALLPFALRALFVLSAWFSLSDENDAAGEGESESGFATRLCLLPVAAFSLWISPSLSEASGDSRTARRAMARRRGV